MANDWNSRRLMHLFDRQIETLKSRGDALGTITEMLVKKKGVVLSQALNLKIPYKEGLTPFIPVIPIGYLGIYGLADLVHYKKKHGYTYLEPRNVTNVVTTPTSLYYIFWVEDGREYAGIKKGARAVTANGSWLTLSETLALGTHTDVLPSHNVDAPGSRYGDNIPGLCLFNGSPRISSSPLSSLRDGWKPASCRLRM